MSKRSKKTEPKLKLFKFPRSYPPGAGRGKSNGPPTPHNGKKTKGRVRKKLFFGLQLTQRDTLDICQLLCQNVLWSNANNPRSQGEDQNGVHRQQAEAVHHLFQEEDWHYEEGQWEFLESWVLWTTSGQRYLIPTNSLFVELSPLLWYFMDSLGGLYNFRLQITSKLVTIGQIFHSPGPSVWEQNKRAEDLINVGRNFWPD